MFVPVNLPTESEAPPPTRPTATPVVVLGADAVLAALPATAVQLAHACLAAGYATAVPVSWGDELLAHAALEQLAERPPGPAVCAFCPRVVERLERSGAELGRFAVRLASPPVATARYLRMLAAGTRLHVTFVGDCPGGADPAIDLQLSPDEFLASLAERGVDTLEQPTAFDAVLPPDRRRHFSVPGGVPAAEALWERAGRRLVELSGEDYALDLAEQLLGEESVLVDLAPALGCACSGVSGGVSPRNARVVVASHEPPRSPSPVVDVRLAVRLTYPGPTPAMPSEPGATAPPIGPRPVGSLRPAPPRRPTPPSVPAAVRPTTPSGGTPAARPTPHGTPMPTPPRAPSLTPAGGVPRRTTPVSLSKLTTGSVPLARRGDGRLLPRAYMARSRSLPALPVVPEEPTLTPPFGFEAATAVATPPAGMPPANEYDHLVNGVAGPSSHAEEWRLQLDESIRAWRARGFRTAVLERARALPHRPDVDGLLTTYAAAAEHLRRLETAATGLHPHVRGHALFRDPERVAAAEAFVARLVGGE